MRILRLLSLSLLLSACATLKKKTEVQKTEQTDDRLRVHTGLALSSEPKNYDPPFRGVKRGILIENVMPYSSAWRAGIRPGDVVADESIEGLMTKIRATKIGDTVQMRLLSGTQIKNVSFRAEATPYSLGNRTYPPELAPFGNSDLSQLSTELDNIKRRGAALPLADLESRFKLLSQRGDELRPELLTYLQRNPFQIQNISQAMLERVRACQGACLHEWTGIALPPKLPIIKKPRPRLESHLQYWVQVISGARALLQQGLAKLSAEEIELLAENAQDTVELLQNSLYVHEDKFLGRRGRFYELTLAIQKIDLKYYFAALHLLQSHFSESYLESLKTLKIPARWEKKTKLGLVIVTGREDDDHRAAKEQNAFLIVDQGGNDLYLDNRGIIFDLDGNDRYESSRAWSLAGAKLNVSLLMDLRGDDVYVCSQGCLGASLLGAAIFKDFHGNDIYRSHTYSVGSALAGVAVFYDGSGNDTYESLLFSQGVGIAGGYGILQDQSGNDIYTAKGLHPSGYGDPGEFEAWSQGVGIGLRYFVSGGMGLLYDRSGKDELSGGTFSQGGGYYFGLGTLINDGPESDTYKGMRYTQGFSAHSAAGIFLEVGGNDLYQSTSFVGEGIAWDLSLSLFEDRAGNDSYKTCNTCMGAAAQSSYAFFVDQAGVDTYRGPEFPYLDALGSEYHGGLSLGLVVDKGGAEDNYEKMQNNSCVKREGLQYICDE